MPGDPPHAADAVAMMATDTSAVLSRRWLMPDDPPHVADAVAMMATDT
jgi:hypothetical protein